jgi:hypothetical protein
MIFQTLRFPGMRDAASSGVSHNMLTAYHSNEFSIFSSEFITIMMNYQDYISP